MVTHAAARPASSSAPRSRTPGPAVCLGALRFLKFSRKLPDAQGTGPQVLSSHWDTGPPSTCQQRRPSGLGAERMRDKRHADGRKGRGPPQRARLPASARRDQEPEKERPAGGQPWGRRWMRISKDTLWGVICRAHLRYYCFGFFYSLLQNLLHFLIWSYKNEKGERERESQL